MLARVPTTDIVHSTFRHRCVPSSATYLFSSAHIHNAILISSAIFAQFTRMPNKEMQQKP